MELKLENISKMSKEELRIAIAAALEHARESSPIDRLAMLQEAQFYTRELEHRHDSRISLRDLVLEIVVILLIGGEILLGYRQGRDEAEASALERQVLSHLEESSAATAGSLTALQETSKQMNEAVQKELAFSYEVSLNVKFDITSDRIIITNEGRTNVALWGSKVGKSVVVMEKGLRMLTPGVPYLITGHEVTTGLTGVVPKGGFAPVPFVMYVKNERGEEFVARYEFAQMLMMGPSHIEPIMLSIAPFEWSKKR